MIQIQKDSQSSSTPSISAYFNYLNKENYFLKASGKSKSSSSGDGCIGCSFQAIKTEINANKHPIMMTQTYSTSLTRLSLPYVFFGLGRINNYIEHFNFAVAKKGDYFNSWSPIIPNSQLLLSANNVRPVKWGIEILINPTQALWLIIASTVCVLIILGVFIVYFHWKEKQEDKKANEHTYSIF